MPNKKTMNNSIDKYDLIVILLTALILLIPITLFSLTNISIDDKLSNTFNGLDYYWLQELAVKQFNKDLFDLDIIEFEVLIKDNYVYNSYKNSLINNQPIRNCKYWSYLYYQWFKSKGYEVKYVLSESHLFVVAYIETGYIILDGDVWNRINLS